jgi:hypothetical protein
VDARILLLVGVAAGLAAAAVGYSRWRHRRLVRAALDATPGALHEKDAPADHVSGPPEEFTNRAEAHPVPAHAPDAPPAAGVGSVAPEIALRYIDLVQEAAARSIQIAGRLFLARVILTGLLVALALGSTDANVKESFEVGGLSFEVERWLLLVAGSILALVMLLFDVPHYERGHRLGWRAARLYEDLGYPVPLAAWHTPDNPLGLPYAAAAPHDALLSRRLSYNTVSVGGTVVATAVLVFVQGFVLWRLGDRFGWTFPVWLFALVPLLTGLVGLGRYLAMWSAFLRGERPWYGMPKREPLWVVRQLLRLFGAAGAPRSVDSAGHPALLTARSAVVIRVDERGPDPP